MVSIWLHEKPLSALTFDSYCRVWWVTSSLLVGLASHLLYSAQNTKGRVKVNLSVRTHTFLDVNAVEYRVESTVNEWTSGTAAVVQVLFSVLHLILNRLYSTVVQYGINYLVFVIICVCNEVGPLYDCWV